MDDKLFIPGSEVPKENGSIALFKKLKGYSEKYPAISIFLLTVGATSISYIAKTLYYAYKLGFNYFFNIPIKYITITDNAFYEILIYVAVSIIIVAFNLFALSKLEKRKLFRYLSIFALIIFIFIFIALEVSNSFKEGFVFNALLSLSISIILVIGLHSYAVISFFKDSDIKVLRSKLLLINLKKKVEKFKGSRFRNTRVIRLLISKHEKKIARVEENLEAIAKISSRPGKGRKANKSIFINAVYSFFLLFALFILFYFLGYSNASNTRIIKTIPKECIAISINERIDAELNEDSYDYAVLFENNSSFLICPYKGKYSKDITLFPTIQVEINKNSIVAIAQSVNKIKH